MYFTGEILLLQGIRIMKEAECRKIYRQSFCDPDTSFEDLLFKYCFEYCHTLVVDGIVVSMLFALPCEFFCGENRFCGVYIYAAATKEDCRKKGYMGELLNIVKKEYGFVFLRPANESLEEYYNKFEFKKAKASDDYNNCVTLIPKVGNNQNLRSGKHGHT